MKLPVLIVVVSVFQSQLNLVASISGSGSGISGQSVFVSLENRRLVVCFVVMITCSYSMLATRRLNPAYDFCNSFSRRYHDI